MKTRLIHTTDEADALMAELSKSADHAGEQLQDLIQHQGGLQVLENIKFRRIGQSGQKTHGVAPNFVTIYRESRHGAGLGHCKCKWRIGRRSFCGCEHDEQQKADERPPKGQSNIGNFQICVLHVSWYGAWTTAKVGERGRHRGVVCRRGHMICPNKNGVPLSQARRFVGG